MCDYKEYWTLLSYGPMVGSVLGLRFLVFIEAGLCCLRMQEPHVEED